MEAELYEAEELPFADEVHEEYIPRAFSGEYVIKIIELLGHSPEEAAKLRDNIPAIISSRIIEENLYQALSANDLTEASAILNTLQHEFIPLDDCLILHLREPNTDIWTEKHLNFARRLIGPYYPDKVRGHVIAVGGPDGKQILLQTWDLNEAHQFDQIFQRYYNWISEQKSLTIGPKFQAIRQELGDWFINELGLKGMNPQEDGFISWFISKKLSSHQLSFELTYDNNYEYSTQGHFQRVRLVVKDLTNYYSPDVIAADFVEYLRWLEEKGREAITKVGLSTQPQLSGRALSPQVKRGISVAPKSTPHENASKRGSYETAQKNKDYAIDYYKREMEEEIRNQLRQNKKPDYKRLHNKIINKLIAKNYTDRTLRNYLPASKREELIGQICRQISEYNALFNK